MNTKSLILKKGLFQNKLLFAIPLMVFTFTSSTKQGKTFNNFFWKKNYFKQQIHKG